MSFILTNVTALSAIEKFNVNGAEYVALKSPPISAITASEPSDVKSLPVSIAISSAPPVPLPFNILRASVIEILS